MYTLKQIPEDFIVTEVSNIPVVDSGRYLYLHVTKKQKNTLDVVKEIARILHIKEREIGFAGSKDKNAVTEQVFSVPIVSKEKISSLNIDNATITIIGYGNKPISLGDLEGNKFEITVRNLDTVTIEKVTHVVNYFDKQRFSTHNVDIGRAIIKKEFNAATKLIDEHKVQQHLEQKPNDHIGALRTLPIRLLRLYVNAYQSYLWNETVARYLKEGKKIPYSQGTFVFNDDVQDIQVPLIGFNDDLITEEFNEIVTALMKEENITFHDFIIRSIPEISLEGGMRNLFVEVKDLEVGKSEEDDLNEGMKKIKVTFTLGKGSYATIVIKRIISAHPSS